MARLHGAPVLGDSWMQDAAPTELIQGGVQREATGPHRKPPKGEPLFRVRYREQAQALKDSQSYWRESYFSILPQLF